METCIAIINQSINNIEWGIKHENNKSKMSKIIQLARLNGIIPDSINHLLISNEPSTQEWNLIVNTAICKNQRFFTPEKLTLQFLQIFFM